MFGASKALLLAFTAVAPALASIDNSKDYDELTVSIPLLIISGGIHVDGASSALQARAVNMQDGSCEFFVVVDVIVELIALQCITDTLTNVGTGETINYLPENHQVFPGDGNSTDLTFAGSGDGPFTKLMIDGLCMYVLRSLFRGFLGPHSDSMACRSSLWDGDAVASGVGADAATVLVSSCRFCPRRISHLQALSAFM